MVIICSLVFFSICSLLVQGLNLIGPGNSPALRKKGDAARFAAPPCYQLQTSPGETSCVPFFFHAAEAKMIGPGIRGALAAGAGLVGGAVLVGAQIRSAPHDALGDARFRGIKTVRRALGIARRLRSCGQVP